MLRSRRDLPILVVALVGFALISVALAVGGPSASQTKQLGAGPKAKNEVKRDTYSGLVREMEHQRVLTAAVDVGTSKAKVLYKDGRYVEVALPPDNGALLRQLAGSGASVSIEGKPSSGGGSGESTGGSILMAVLTPLIFIGVIVLFFAIMKRRAAQGKGGGGFGGGMMPDTSLRKDTELDEIPGQRFRDVAGVDEAVEELAEVVEFFQNPGRFEHLGAKLPSGIMLYGDPGTGKTLLAKALAGEAGIPFYATSGSDFVEKFVGVGASRVRELFAKARANPNGAVVFIDEIDAVGRARSAGEANGEREQTLNQILVELDGFSVNDRVLCIAATNRLDVLDPALLRPGRFGRHIAVPLPSAGGRASILRIYTQGKPLAADVDVEELAATMGGLSGAQLADVVNEAAIMAGREGLLEIRRSHFREGYLRVLAGPKRKSAPIAEGELEVISAHEAGHVLAAEYGERYEKAQQVSVEPRAQAMGLAVYGQTDRALHDPDYLHEALVATLAGRAAEQLVFGRISSGAANDLQKATELARRAVEELGFSPRVGQIVAGRSPFSETTRTVIDSEIERMVADAYGDALDVLTEHREQLDRLRARLVEQRELERVDILTAIGSVAKLPQRAPRPVPHPVPTLRPQGMPLAATEDSDR
jgi:cell division protease FtsH